MFNCKIYEKKKTTIERLQDLPKILDRIINPKYIKIHAKVPIHFDDHEEEN